MTHDPAPRTAYTGLRTLLAVALLVAGPAVALLSLVLDLPWASGPVSGRTVVEVDAGELADDGEGAVPLQVVLAFLGCFGALWLGITAVPRTRTGRALATLPYAGAAVLLGVLLVSDLNDVSTGDSAEIVTIAVLLAVPLVVLPLVLLARGARRGTAVCSLVLAAVGLAAQVVTVLRLLSGDGDLRAGTLLTTLALVLSTAGALAFVRALPARPAAAVTG